MDITCTTDRAATDRERKEGSMTREGGRTAGAMLEGLLKSIRRALGRAIGERMEPEPAARPPDAATFKPLQGDGSGWVSPVYCESRAVALDAGAAAENRCVTVVADRPENEIYKVLRTQILQRTRERGWNTLMVTSALPGEGKSTTAVNLALAFARDFNHTVLLVDCDLRRQSIHKLLGFSGGLGLTDCLLDGCGVKDLIVWPGIEKFTVISGGRTVQESAELVASPKMKALVSEMKARYADRYVFFDVPPLLTSADALAFTPLVDGILLVVQANRTSSRDVQRALDLIPRDKFLGFVLNRHGNHAGRRART